MLSYSKVVVKASKFIFILEPLGNLLGFSYHTNFFFVTLAVLAEIAIIFINHFALVIAITSLIIDFIKLLKYHSLFINQFKFASKVSIMILFLIIASPIGHKFTSFKFLILTIHLHLINYLFLESFVMTLQINKSSLSKFLKLQMSHRL